MKIEVFWWYIHIEYEKQNMMIANVSFCLTIFRCCIIVQLVIRKK